MTDELAKNKAHAALLEIVNIIQEAIDASPSGIPSGHLYARLMPYMTIDTYTQIISALVKAGRITNNGHLLESTHHETR